MENRTISATYYQKYGLWFLDWICLLSFYSWARIRGKWAHGTILSTTLRERFVSHLICHWFISPSSEWIASQTRASQWRVTTYSFSYPQRNDAATVSNCAKNMIKSLAKVIACIFPDSESGARKLRDCDRFLKPLRPVIERLVQSSIELQVRNFHCQLGSTLIIELYQRIDFGQTTWQTTTKCSSDQTDYLILGAWKRRAVLMTRVAPNPKWLPASGSVL